MPHWLLDISTAINNFFKQTALKETNLNLNVAQAFIVCVKKLFIAVDISSNQCGISGATVWDP